MREVRPTAELWTSLECRKKYYHLNLNERCLEGNSRWQVFKDVDETKTLYDQAE